VKRAHSGYEAYAFPGAPALIKVLLKGFSGGKNFQSALKLKNPAKVCNCLPITKTNLHIGLSFRINMLIFANSNFLSSLIEIF